MNDAAFIFSPTGGMGKTAAALTGARGTAARTVELTDAGRLAGIETMLEQVCPNRKSCGLY